MNDLIPEIPKLDDTTLSLRRDHLLAEVARGQRSRRHVTALGTTAAAAAIATGTLIGLSAVGPGRANAYAGWTPTPSATNPAAAAAGAACPSVLTVTGKGTSLHLRAVLAERRGPLQAVLLQGAGGLVTCLSGPNFGVSEGGVGPAPVTPLASGRVSLDHVSTTGRRGGDYTLVEGRSGPGVTHVKLVLADSTVVTASTANGWLLAWWPGDQHIAALQITTAAGDTTQPFTPASAPPTASR
jgi:hypothetical protein